MAKTRIYLVTAGGERRLVQAANQSRAIRHVAERTITCSVASQLELVELVRDGTLIEKAGDEQAQPEDEE